MSNKKYLILKFTDYGYEIYAITGTKRIKLNKQDKMLMYSILKNFKCITKNENTYIYPNYRLITLHFAKEKLKLTPKKVNRHKSRQVIIGILLATTIISSTTNKSDQTIKCPPDESGITFESTIPTVPKTTISHITYEELEFIEAIDKELDNTENTIPFDDQEENQDIESINEFSYEYKTPNDKEALANAEEYMEVFSKYEKIYGVDAKLLCAIGAQESSGIHHNKSTNGGYATGIMGIEYIWDGGEIRVFNFEKNCYETIVVDYSRIGELDYNVKIGAAIFQNYFYNTLKKSNTIDATEQLAFTLQKYNMGPGNMGKVLSYDGNWIDNRDMINAGDKYYFEHVLSRLDNGTVIRIKLTDGSYHETTLINTALEYQQSRT